ncbi:hypothetical protein WA026_001411 [Henosepilachna vigintioctopunctata]|uniref:Uncharacterized protein n=1 Tax=Henosepilachna vigintioctopunctata TaxID=420089 RepID=A0AAW1URW9_9CUCU
MAKTKVAENGATEYLKSSSCPIGAYVLSEYRTIINDDNLMLASLTLDQIDANGNSGSGRLLESELEIFVGTSKLALGKLELAANTVLHQEFRTLIIKPIFMHSSHRSRQTHTLSP